MFKPVALAPSAAIWILSPTVVTVTPVLAVSVLNDISEFVFSLKTSSPPPTLLAVTSTASAPDVNNLFSNFSTLNLLELFYLNLVDCVFLKLHQYYQLCMGLY